MDPPSFEQAVFLPVEKHIEGSQAPSLPAADGAIAQSWSFTAAAALPTNQYASRNLDMAVQGSVDPTAAVMAKILPTIKDMLPSAVHDEISEFRGSSFKSYISVVRGDATDFYHYYRLDESGSDNIATNNTPQQQISYRLSCRRIA